MARAFLLVCLLAATAIGVFAQTCSDDFTQDFQADGNKLQITTFLTLVKALGVTIGAGAYTVFAPTDSAFKGAIGALGVDADPSKWTPAQKEAVTSLIEYHIAPGVQQKTTTLSKFGASFKTSANNLKLCKSVANKQDKDNSDNFDAVTFLREAGKTTIKAGFNSANIVSADNDNTCFPQLVLHTIDAVLLPCSPENILAGAKAALVPSPPPPAPKRSPPPPPACKLGTVEEIILKTKDTVAAQIAQLVAGEDFNGTVFMPTEEVLSATRDNLLAAVGNDTNLATILPGAVGEVNKYHVIPDEVISLKSAPKGELTTLLSGKQTFCKPASDGTLSVTGGASPAVQAAGSKANIVKTEQACNGVVYYVDALLLPCPLNESILAPLAAALPEPTAKNNTPKATGADKTGAGAGTTDTPTIGTRSTPATNGTPVFVPGAPAPSDSTNKTVQQVRSAAFQSAATSSLGLVLAAVMAMLLL